MVIFWATQSTDSLKQGQIICPILKRDTFLQQDNCSCPRQRKGRHPNGLPLQGSLRNAASSSGLTTSVRKITWSHNPQPVSRSTSCYKTSLEPKSPQHFEILPAMGERRGSEEESGRKKETAAFPSQYLLRKLRSPLYTQSKSRSYFFSPLSWKKDGQKSHTLLYSCKYPTPSLPGLLVSWSTEAAAFTGLQSTVQRWLSVWAFLIFNPHLKPSELLQSITKCPLSFSQNQAFNFKNIYLDLWKSLILTSDCMGKLFDWQYVHNKITNWKKTQ